MKIVIDIDEDIVQGIIDGKNDEPRNIVRAFQATIADAIKNSTPIDLEGLKSDMKALNCGFLKINCVVRIVVSMMEKYTQNVLYANVTES